jgi:hypothetical protein
MPFEIHGGQDFPAQWAAHRRVQLSGGPLLEEFSQQLHLPGLAGGILAGTSLPQLLAAVFLCENFPGLRFVAAVGHAASRFAQIAPLRTTGGFFLRSSSRTAGPTAGAFEAVCFL